MHASSVVSDSFNPMGWSHQDPLFMGFPRQEKWSGLPFPPPGDLLDPGIEPMSPALQVDFFFTTHQTLKKKKKTRL